MKKRILLALLVSAHLMALDEASQASTTAPKQGEKSSGKCTELLTREQLIAQQKKLHEERKKRMQQKHERLKKQLPTVTEEEETTTEQ